MDHLVMKFLGNNCSISTQSKVAHHNWTGGNAYGDYAASHAWWEGLARLVVDGQEKVFQFETRKHRDAGIDEITPFENEFIVIKGVTKKVEIPDIAPIVDAFCEKILQLVNAAEAKEDALPVVSIELPFIDGEPFVEQGIIIEPGLQLEFKII